VLRGWGHIQGDDELASRDVDHHERKGQEPDELRLVQEEWRLLQGD
jgi:hypothetical protein